MDEPSQLILERSPADRISAHSVVGRDVRNDAPSTGPTRRDQRRAAIAANHRLRWIVALWAGLVVVVFFSKWVLLPFPVTTAGELLRYLLRLAIVTSADVAFATTLALVSGVVGVLASRNRRGAWIWKWATLAAFTFAGWYALVSIPIYRVAMIPFTLRLLAITGSPTIMASSIEPYVTWSTLIGIVGVPVLMLAALQAIRLIPRLKADCAMRSAILVTSLMLIAVYASVCYAYRQSQWTDPNRWERRISYSPHAVLLGSCIEEVLSDRSFTSSFMFAEADMSDFERTSRTDDGGSPVAIAEGSAKRPTNVVYIVIESLAAEYAEVFGGEYPTMPRLAERAREEGVVFENAYVQAASSCKSLLALTASVYPRPDWCLIVRDCPEFDVPTIQEVLKEHDYRTSYLHSGPWRWKQRDRFLCSRGVDALIDDVEIGGNRVSSWGVSDRRMFQSGLDWIDEGGDQPFFMFTYTIETHHPYVAAEPLTDYGVDDPELNRYLNAVAATDANIDWFLTELERRGLDESTLVVVTSDHGESFGQHNQRVHNFSVYESAVHVPLVMLHPGLRGNLNLPARSEAVCQHVDVAPTVLDAVGISGPTEWQGRSLRGNDVDGPLGEKRAYFLATGNHVVLGLRDGPWKYHYYVGNGREELFELDDDPHELLNLAVREPKRVEGYRRRVAGLIKYQREYLRRHGVR